MSHIVVSGASILGTAFQSETLPDGDTLADGVVYPASVPGWSIVEAGALPKDFSIQVYGWIDGAVTKKPDSAEEIAETMAGKLLALVAFTSERQGANVTIAAVGGFPTSFASGWLGLINGAYLAAQADSAFTTEWQDEQDDIHTLTAPQVIALWQEGTAYTNACFSNQSTHARAIRALTSVEAIEAYDFTTGWPSVTN